MSTPLQPPTFGREQSNASIPVEDDKKEDLYTTVRSTCACNPWHNWLMSPTSSLLPM